MKSRCFMKKTMFVLMSVLAGTWLNACAFDLVHVKQIPTQITLISPSRIPFVLEQDITVDLGYGYKRTLKQGTRWTYVGAVSYGDVFKTKDQILTVEASNIHEAYIVVSSDQLVGFYLPVEQSYSPLDNPKKLRMNERRAI